MAKSKPTVKVEVSRDEIAKALEGIADWVRAVRSVVLTMDPNAKGKVEVPKKVMNVPVGDGCPPPDPCDDDEPAQTVMPVGKRRARRAVR